MDCSLFEMVNWHPHSLSLYLHLHVLFFLFCIPFYFHADYASIRNLVALFIHFFNFSCLFLFCKRSCELCEYQKFYLVYVFSNIWRYVAKFSFTSTSNTNLEANINELNYLVTIPVKHICLILCFYIM